MREIFMSRQPLVNRQSRIIATRLMLHLRRGTTMRDAAATLGAMESVWPPGEKPVFVSCGSAGCTSDLLDWSTPSNATIEIPAAALVGTDGPSLIAAIQTWQPTLCLQFDPRATQALTQGLTYRFVGFDARRSVPRSCSASTIAARSRWASSPTSSRAAAIRWRT